MFYLVNKRKPTFKLLKSPRVSGYGKLAICIHMVCHRSRFFPKLFVAIDFFVDSKTRYLLARGFE